MHTETWLDTQKKFLLAEVAIHGYNVFWVYKPTSTEKGCGSIVNIKNTLNLIECKIIATCTSNIMQVDIIPKNAVHLKLLLIYQNTRITAADDDLYTMLESIFITKHKCVIMYYFKHAKIDWITHIKLTI